VIGLCERFGCLPSQLYQEDAELLRLLNIYTRGNPKRDDKEGGGFDDQ
jgi:hypothetical protein